MRYILASLLLALPLLADSKPLPGHVTLVRPVLPAKKPVLQSLVIPRPAPARLVASTAACSHIVIIPVDPGIDANIPRHESRTTHNMPSYAGSPACR